MDNEKGNCEIDTEEEQEVQQAIMQSFGTVCISVVSCNVN